MKNTKEKLNFTILVIFEEETKHIITCNLVLEANGIAAPYYNTSLN